MTLRPVVRSALCLCAVAAGVALGLAFPPAFVHFVWGGFTAAVALFLMDPPQVSIRIGRKEETPAPAVQEEPLREQARRLELKDHALRERERRLREKEMELRDRVADLVRRENEVRAQAHRGGARFEAPPERVAIARTPEEWLGVRRGASHEEVRQAWVALAKTFHPDRMRDLPAWAREDAERRMKAINEAYETLRR
jgi:hypothetical protein